MGNTPVKPSPTSCDEDVEAPPPPITPALSSEASLAGATTTLRELFAAANLSPPPEVYGSLDPEPESLKKLDDISTNLTTRFDKAEIVCLDEIGLDDSADRVKTFVNNDVYCHDDIWSVLSTLDKAKWCYLILRRFPQSIETHIAIDRNTVLKRHFASDEDYEDTKGTEPPKEPKPHVNIAKRLHNVVKFGGDQFHFNKHGIPIIDTKMKSSYITLLEKVPAWKTPKSSLYNGARAKELTPPCPFVRFQYAHSPVCSVLCIAHMVFFKAFKHKMNGYIMNILRTMREDYSDEEIFKYVTLGEGRNVRDLLLKVLRQWNPGKSLTALTSFHGLVTLAPLDPELACKCILESIRYGGAGLVVIDNFQELKNPETFTFHGKWSDDNVTPCPERSRHCLSVQGAIVMKVNEKDELVLMVQDFSSTKQFFGISLELLASMPNADDEGIWFIGPRTQIALENSDLPLDDVEYYYEAAASCGPSPSGMELLEDKKVPQISLPILDLAPQAQTSIAKSSKVDPLRQFSKLENVGFFCD